jgi:hypothetical protein
MQLPHDLSNNSLLKKKARAYQPGQFIELLLNEDKTIPLN